MTLLPNRNWVLGVFAVVSLLAGADYLLMLNNESNEPQPVQFSQLTDADIDLILAVKEEMYAAKIQAN